MMTKREREAELWSEYYHAICSYEAWRDVNSLVNRVKSKLKQSRKMMTQYESDTYMKLCEAAERLSELSGLGYQKYCAKKPQKPDSRPYGDL